MKKIAVWLLVLGLALLVPSKALANEGTIKLAPTTGNVGRCFASSVFIDSTYRILMTCRDLKNALDPENNKYVVWSELVSSGRKRRLGEIINGKMMGSSDERFDRLFVTAEKDSYLSKPVGGEVLSGSIETIDFGGAVSAAAKVTSAPSVKAGTNQEVPSLANTQQPSKLVSVVTGIGKAILVGFVILLLIVGIMSWLARRKSL